MSEKWRFTASLMLISLQEIPRVRISSQELLYVRSEVPKQGMVTPQTSDAGRPSRRMASTDTSSARVESSPPEMPTTAFALPRMDSRCFSPATCMWKISMHRRTRFCFPVGTKGSFANG